MPEWLTKHWQWIIGIVFGAGAFVAILRALPRRIDAAFRRIDEERERGIRTRETILEGFARIDGKLDELLRELNYQRQGHHDQLDKLNPILGQVCHGIDRLIDKLDVLLRFVSEHDKRLSVDEQRLETLEEQRREDREARK